jgi:MFS family permease
MRRMSSEASDAAHGPNSPLVWGLAVATTVSWGILFYAFALFVTPMESDLGWSRTELNAALSLGLLTAGLAAIPAGQWIDRRGGRLLMTSAALLGSVMLLAWSQVTSPWVFVAIWIGLGLAQAGTLYEPVFAVLTANVKDYRRAIIFVTFVGGLASTIFIPLANWLIGAFGWRHALVALAAIEFLFACAVYFLVLRGTRGSLTPSSGGLDDAPAPFRLAPVLRKPAFIGLFACFVGYGFMWSAVTFHIVPLLTERGLALDSIVAAIALIGPSQVLGRLLLFAFGAKAAARDIGRWIVVIPVVAILVLIAAAPFGFWGLAAFAVVYGLGNGMITIVRGAGVAEILGTAGYGAISGAITLGNSIAKAVGPIAVAWLWTSAGAYGPILWLWVAVMAASAIAFWYAAAAR